MDGFLIFIGASALLALAVIGIRKWLNKDTRETTDTPTGHKPPAHGEQ